MYWITPPRSIAFLAGRDGILVVEISEPYFQAKWVRRFVFTGRSAKFDVTLDELNGGGRGRSHHA